MSVLDEAKVSEEVKRAMIERDDLVVSERRLGAGAFGEVRSSSHFAHPPPPHPQLAMPVALDLRPLPRSRLHASAPHVLAWCPASTGLPST